MAVKKDPRTPGNRFLSHLAFENPLLRACLELSLCVVLFTVVDRALSTGSLEYRSLMAWFVACTAVCVMDYFLFLRPVLILRRAQLLSQLGDLPQALGALDLLARSPIPCPSSLFHFRRAQFYMFGGEYEAALVEIREAARTGLSPVSVAQFRIELFRIKGDFDRSRTELARASAMGLTRAALAFEEGLLLISKRSDYHSAANLFREAGAGRTLRHWSGEQLAFLASGFQAVCELWRGRAEEGLPKLSRAIARLESIARSNELLRPYLAHLKLERATYLASHRLPHEAVADLRSSLTLCQYPHLLLMAKRVEEDLCWRYKVLPCQFPPPLSVAEPV